VGLTTALSDGHITPFTLTFQWQSTCHSVSRSEASAARENDGLSFFGRPFLGRGVPKANIKNRSVAAAHAHSSSGLVERLLHHQACEHDAGGLAQASFFPVV
jgi:hypothetical protein